ncbi:MAG: TRAP transporter small permease [SAR324 cluster bacterium]|nr:TRAP transporter small permease [SAR324 cluster bacterium]
MSQKALSASKSKFDIFLDSISYISNIVCGVSLVIMTVIFGWLVFGRYVLNATPTWVEQVSLLLVVLMGFVGASVGVHQNTHLGVSVFRELCPKPVRRVFELISHFTMGGFGIIMAINSYDLAVFKWGSEIPLIHVPEGMRAIPIMLCGIFVFLYSVGHLIHFFKGIEEEYDLTK